MITIVKDTVLSTWKFLRLDLKYLTTTVMLIILILVIISKCIYIYQIAMLYTLQIYNYICQLFPRRVKEEKKENGINSKLNTLS